LTTIADTPTTTPQLDELAALVILARNMSAKPCRWGLAVALGLDRDETRAMLTALIDAGRLERRHLARDPDMPPGSFDFAHVARSQLVRRGQVLTPEAIAGRVAELEAIWPKIISRTVENDAWRADTLTMAPRVVALVAKARAATGTAPTWGEVGRVYNWSTRREITVRLAYLVRTGWLFGTKEPRSLDVGPLGRAILERAGEGANRARRPRTERGR
jgi:hypothetical protein